jgi:hypothetical protein
LLYYTRAVYTYFGRIIDGEGNTGMACEREKKKGKGKGKEKEIHSEDGRAQAHPQMLVIGLVNEMGQQKKEKKERYFFRSDLTSPN